MNTILFFFFQATQDVVVKTESWMDQAMQMVVKYAPKAILAVITLILGFWIIGRISKWLSKILSNSLDSSLAKFLSSLFDIALKIMLLMSVAQMVGINTTSFIAIFSALMIGIGMALNGTIGNVASGVMLMIFRPFKVGDLVEIGGGSLGTVEEISAFNTILQTLDNKRIIVANSNVTGNTITNISGQGTVGVELSYHIGYDQNIDEARKVILAVGKQCPYVLEDPAQAVVVADLGESSIELATRPFCNSENYWDTLFYMKEHVFKAFAEAGIEVPYNKMDVEVINK